jgi:hypothetical protein
VAAPRERLYGALKQIQHGRKSATREPVELLHHVGAVSVLVRREKLPERLTFNLRQRELVVDDFATHDGPHVDLGL